MRFSTAWRASAAALSLAMAAACATGAWKPRPHVPECAGELEHTASIPGDFVWRERLRYRSAEVDASLELVIEKRGPRLVVVGFNELGAKAFSIVQEGREAEAQSFLGPAEAVPPLTALRDLHRARFAPGEFPLAPAPNVTIRPPGCGYVVTFARLSSGRLD